MTMYRLIMFGLWSAVSGAISVRVAHHLWSGGSLLTSWLFFQFVAAMFIARHFIPMYRWWREEMEIEKRIRTVEHVAKVVLK